MAAQQQTKRWTAHSTAPCTAVQHTVLPAVVEMTVGVQAVALGAAVQAGILEGQISDVMVLDVWQANLMRALAQQRLQQDGDSAAALGLTEEGFSDEVGRPAVSLCPACIKSRQHGPLLPYIDVCLADVYDGADQIRMRCVRCV